MPKNAQLMVAAAALVGSLACGLTSAPQATPTPVSQPDATQTPAVIVVSATPAAETTQAPPSEAPATSGPESTPTGQGGATSDEGGGEQLHQWASSASATSQLDDAHSAAQAAGEPGTEGCNFNGYEFKLYPGGWTSAGEDTVETLTLSYVTPVIPTGIVIHQLTLPNAVTKVEVADLTGASHTAYTGMPYDLDYCPYLMQVQVQDVTQKIQTVIITLDQSMLGKRNEIGSVELVGSP